MGKKEKKRLMRHEFDDKGLTRDRSDLLFFPAQLRSNNSSSTKRQRPLSPGVNTTSAAQPLRHYGTLALVVWALLGKGFG